MSNLSRYKKYETDWQVVEADVAHTPFFKSYLPNPKGDRQRLELTVDRRKLPRSLYDISDVEYYVNQTRREQGLVAFPELYGNVGSSGPSFFDVHLHFAVKPYCEALGIPLAIVNDEPIPHLNLRGKGLACVLGWHTFEHGDPEIMEYVRQNTGLFTALFGSYLGVQDAIQVGIKRCRYCGKEQHVLRAGVWPLGGGTPWKKTTQKEYDRVVALPGLSM